MLRRRVATRFGWPHGRRESVPNQTSNTTPCKVAGGVPTAWILVLKPLPDANRYPPPAQARWHCRYPAICRPATTAPWTTSRGRSRPSTRCASPCARTATISPVSGSSRIVCGRCTPSATTIPCRPFRCTNSSCWGKPLPPGRDAQVVRLAIFPPLDCAWPFRPDAFRAIPRRPLSSSGTPSCPAARPPT